jgi:hypothetical protein
MADEGVVLRRSSNLWAPAFNAAAESLRYPLAKIAPTYGSLFAGEARGEEFTFRVETKYEIFVLDSTVQY